MHSDTATATNASAGSQSQPVVPMAQCCPQPPATATSIVTHTLSDAPNSSRSMSELDSRVTNPVLSRVPGAVPDPPGGGGAHPTHHKIVPTATLGNLPSTMAVWSQAPALQHKVPLAASLADTPATSRPHGGEQRADWPPKHAGSDIVHEMRHGAPIGHVNSITKHSHHSSISSSQSLSGDMCRICHCEAAADSPLISPCRCAGTLRFVHQSCLQQWIRSSQTTSCEVCRYTFLMYTRLKPFTKWEKLDMSPMERKKVLCSIAFHIIAITCVVWSLYVLIDRTFDEAVSSNFYWPFWTKLVVVAVGIAGGAVFMYVQCKMYAHLCKRWHAYNRVIYVQNCPETVQIKSKAKGDRCSSRTEPSGGTPVVIGVDEPTPAAAAVATAPAGGERHAVTLRHAGAHAAAAAAAHGHRYTPAAIAAISEESSPVPSHEAKMHVHNAADDTAPHVAHT